MNFNFNSLSFWEKKWLFEDIDFAIIGAGIVGLSAAYHIKKKHPSAKVIVLDKGTLPFSASSKNAGFACFGSPTEILDDLSNSSSKEVWETVEMRWKGLLALKEWLGVEEIDLKTFGSWDLIESAEKAEEVRDQLFELNQATKQVIGQDNIFSEDKNALDRFGFENLSSSFKNKLEGQLDTSLLIQAAIQKVNQAGVTILRGVTLNEYSSSENGVELNTNFGTLKTKNLILCTNGFTSEINQKWDIKPARSQVLVTNEIPNLKFKGTFHIDHGYYYFRNVCNRLLIGGGRNLNFKSEETFEMETTTEIQEGILNKIDQIILPKTYFKVDYKWSGIMGVGQLKQPIIERVDARVCVGIRMGGMGVAIGTLVGKTLAEMHT